jgi:formylglycine-generating enzyme required for sulfatase activity/tRNA A-37 threonylcarbamoyl transferase component Bud32
MTDDATRDTDLPGAQPVFTRLEPRAGVASLRPGRVLAERFEVRERIGVGGMGEVYAAWDRRLGKEVAIKVIRPELLADAAVRQAFLAEGRIACELSHPNIVNVYDVHLEGDVHFLAMERLTGRTLRDEMDERRQRRQGFELARVRGVLGDVAAALHDAHRRTVHRDVKPENVFLCADGTAKLMDFGIAAALRSGGGDDARAISRGSAVYAAPEQVRDPANADPRSDQFGLAAIGYEMVTGRPPAAMSQPIRALRPDAPRSLARAIERGLATEPADRFPDVEAFARAATAAPNALQELWLDPRVRIGGAGALVLILLAAGLMLRGGGSIVPEGDPRADALQAQGEALAIRTRLDEARADLARRAREARDTPDAALLEEASALTERHVFGGPELLGLEGRLRVGGELVKSGDWADALAAFQEAKRAVAALLSRAEAIEGSVLARARAVAGERDWREGAARGAWPEPEEATRAATALERGHAAMSAADFEAARSGFESAAADFAVALERGPRLAAEASAARSAAARAALLERAAAKLVAVPAGALPGRAASVAAFAIDRTEVTVAEYAECVAAGACSPAGRAEGCNAGAGRSNHPINCVTWSQARAYCGFVEKRLPRDVEWERAARGDDGRPYPWGSAPASCDRAVVGDPQGSRRDGCGRDSTWEVGSKPAGASPFGALDMAGNVGEWTQEQTLRGGDWLFAPDRARADAVARPEPDRQRTNAGFRCAR